MFRTIKTKIMSAQIALVLIASVAFGVSTYYLLINTMYKQQREYLDHIAKESSDSVDETIERKREEFARIAKGSDIVGYTRVSEEKVLVEYFAKFVKSFSVLAYVNEQGQEELKMVNGTLAPKLSDISDTALFKQAMEKPGEVYMSFVAAGSNINKVYVEFAFCNKNFFDEFSGLIVGKVPLLNIFEEFRTVQIGQTGFIVLLDNDGTVLSHPVKDKILQDILAKDQESAKLLYQAKSMKTGYGRIKMWGRDYDTAFTPVKGRNWSVLATMSCDEFMAAPNRLKNTTLMIFVAVLVLCVLVSLFVAGNITKPILGLVGAVKSMASGDLSQRVKVKRKDEVGTLGKTFNRMADDLSKTTTSIDNLNREIVERKKAEQRQAQLLKDVENANKELKDFAHIVSHDLKAPLRGVSAITNWLVADYADKIDENGKEQLSLLLTRVERMHNLIEGVLRYSRAGSGEEQKIQVNLNELLPEVIDMVAAPKSIKVTVESEMPIVICDQTRIAQVFQNLLSNAVKYMDKPKGIVQLGCVEENGFWKFNVTDNGPGIDEKHFEQVFKMFQTLTPKDEYESTGVGLTVIKKIVEMYGGEIWLESELGKGTTFFFTFPISEQQQAVVVASDGQEITQDQT